jgi:ACS family glucarate transporter-like MFS transporter
MKSIQPVSSTARARNVIVLLMLALSVLSYIDRTAISIAGPTLIKEFGFSETQMGSIYSVFILSYALFMFPGGWLADRFGPRLILALTSLGSALFTALTAFAGLPMLSATLGVLPSFLWVRLGFGLCTAPLYPACGRLTANWFPVVSRARVQGVVLSGAALGGAITPILFSRLIGSVGWRVSLGMAAAATAAVSIIAYWHARDTPPNPALEGERVIPKGATDTQALRKPEWRELFANRNLMLLTIGYFTLNYFEYIFFYWIYYYFGEVRHLGRDQSAIYTTVLLLTMMVMMPLGGWLADRLTPRWGAHISRRRVAVAGMALSALLLYLGIQITNTPVMVALLSLALGLAASAEGPFWASAIDAGGRQAGAAGGLLNAVGNVGGLLAPTLTPYLAERFGWTAGLHFASLMVLLGAASWFLTRPMQDLSVGRPSQAEQPS